MMDAFVVSIAWHNMVFARTANGEIWRLWFGDAGGPYIERLVVFHAEWDEPVRILEAQLPRPLNIVWPGAPLHVVSS